MKSVSETYEAKTFDTPDEVREFEHGKVELVTVSGKPIGRATFEPGWRWSECVGPIAKTETCEAAHFGYQLKGTMHVLMDGGEEYTIRAGEVFSIPAGHDAWVEGDETVVCVDFQGMAEYAKAKQGAKIERPGRKH